MRFGARPLSHLTQGHDPADTGMVEVVKTAAQRDDALVADRLPTSIDGDRQWRFLGSSAQDSGQAEVTCIGPDSPK
jgi:hypothetical protein